MSFSIFEFSYLRGRLVVKISMYAKFLRNGGQMDSLIPNPESFLWRAKLQAAFSRTGIYFLVGSASFKVTNFACTVTNALLRIALLRCMRTSLGGEAR